MARPLAHGSGSGCKMTVSDGGLTLVCLPWFFSCCASLVDSRQLRYDWLRHRGCRAAPGEAARQVGWEPTASPLTHAAPLLQACVCRRWKTLAMEPVRARNFCRLRLQLCAKSREQSLASCPKLRESSLAPAQLLQLARPMPPGAIHATRAIVQ